MPAGEFMMGSPASEAARSDDEGPQRKVTIAKPFAVARFAVTRGEFAAFVRETNHAPGDSCMTYDNGGWKAGRSFRNPGFTQDDRHPVVCVSWDDAKAFATWLSKKTNKPYRLLSEAEREYATRAGTTTPFWWGSSISTTQANYRGDYYTYGGGSKGEYRGGTVPVDSFKANPWGLYNVHGNVSEWVEDCWTKRVWTKSGRDCGTRGGSWGLGEPARCGQHVNRPGVTGKRYRLPGG